ncbi:MAG TPA: hypothetical protein VFT99_12725, partial [Roseiflexaceae bacterium]|nr:hypothetical protein [Roseiflexaceae bacterium]
RTNFTQLWMLPAEQTTLPSVRLGIRNDEPAALTYRLQLRQGEQVLQEWPAIELSPGQEWQATVPIVNMASSSAPVEARLFRSNAPDQVYRQTRLWLQP